ASTMPAARGPSAPAPKAVVQVQVEMLPAALGPPPPSREPPRCPPVPLPPGGGTTKEPPGLPAATSTPLKPPLPVLDEALRTQTPPMQSCWAGQVTPSQLSLQEPATHTVAGGLQVCFSQPGSTQWWLAAQTWPDGQPWQSQEAMQTPFSQ